MPSARAGEPERTDKSMRAATSVGVGSGPLLRIFGSIAGCPVAPLLAQAALIDLLVLVSGGIGTFRCRIRCICRLLGSVGGERGGSRCLLCGCF